MLKVEEVREELQVRIAWAIAKSLNCDWVCGKLGENLDLKLAKLLGVNPVYKKYRKQGHGKWYHRGKIIKILCAWNNMTNDNFVNK